MDTVPSVACRCSGPSTPSAAWGSHWIIFRPTIAASEQVPPLPTILPCHLRQPAGCKVCRIRCVMFCALLGDCARSPDSRAQVLHRRKPGPRLCRAHPPTSLRSHPANRHRPQIPACSSASSLQCCREDVPRVSGRGPRVHTAACASEHCEVCVCKQSAIRSVALRRPGAHRGQVHPARLHPRHPQLQALPVHREPGLRPVPPPAWTPPGAFEQSAIRPVTLNPGQRKSPASSPCALTRGRQAESGLLYSLPVAHCRAAFSRPRCSHSSTPQ